MRLSFQCDRAEEANVLVAFDHYDAKSRSTLLQVGASSASRFAKPRSADWLRPPTI